jgi:hypothetical protein
MNMHMPSRASSSSLCRTLCHSSAAHTLERQDAGAAPSLRHTSGGPGADTRAGEGVERVPPQRILF